MGNCSSIVGGVRLTSELYDDYSAGLLGLVWTMRTISPLTSESGGLAMTSASSEMPDKTSTVLPKSRPKATGTSAAWLPWTTMGTRRPSERKTREFEGMIRVAPLDLILKCTSV